jgi:hypothetical protein
LSRICNTSSDLDNLSVLWLAPSLCRTYLQLNVLSSKLSWWIQIEIPLEILLCRDNVLQEMNGGSLSILLITWERSVWSGLSDHRSSPRPIRSFQKRRVMFYGVISSASYSYIRSSSVWKSFV